MNNFWKLWHIGGGVLLFTFWILSLIHVIDLAVFPVSILFSLTVGICSSSAIILGIRDY